VKQLRERMRRDDGIGLNEVMVALLLLAILLMAMVAILIAALNVITRNATRATATELATQRIEEARVTAVSGDCAVLRAVAEATTNLQDGRGIPLTVSGTVANCTQTTSDPHDEPQLARVTVTITTTHPGYTNPVATLTSDIYVRFEP